MIYRYLPYTLTLRAPVVMTSLGGDPNGSRTLAHIPGSALRGAAAAILGDPDAEPERYGLFRKLILDGTVRFFNAYPRMQGHRTLPMPVSLRLEKHAPPASADAVKAWDLAAFYGSADREGLGWPNTLLADVPEPFITLVAAQPTRVQPDRGTRVHQQRDRTKGRAWKDAEMQQPHGTIFAFEFLEADQEFDGFLQIVAESEAMYDALAERIRQVLQGPLLLGRSRRGGYGGDATIEWRDPQQREVLGQGVVNAEIPQGSEFRAVLTSAYIGRHPATGQLDPFCLHTELADRLGGRVETVRRRWTFELVGGFNRKWRLEIPQAAACAGGSVLVLLAKERVPLDALLAVEHDGLGERRVEGFGRLVFLGAAEPTIVLRRPTRQRSSRQAGAPPEVVRWAEHRVIDAAVSRVIHEEAARLARDAKGPPSRSLLGRLRNAMRAEPAVALQTVCAWMDERAGSGQAGSAHHLRRPAMDQLDRCQLAGRQQLSAWLRDMASRRARLGKALNLDALAQRLHIVSEATAQDHLSAQDAWLRVRLIDATLAALLRRDGRSS